jgi:uncharacterized protein with HEPN domain
MYWSPPAASSRGAPAEVLWKYEADRQFRCAVEREFEIIGEALGRLKREDESLAAKIDQLPKIVGFRNRIIHGYDSIDDASVRGIASDHLPKLADEIELLLKEV